MRIKSISEAFSMQPSVFFVMDKPCEFVPHESCKEIKEETYTTSNGEDIAVYCGYNFEGKKIFQYLSSAVNVHYF